MKRYENIQSHLWNFVKGGCLFFSILAAYEDKYDKRLDFIEIFQWSILRTNLSLDGTVNDSLAILNHIDGKQWKRKIVGDLLEIPKDKNGFIIECWESPQGKTHFKPQGYDVFSNSQIVRTGHIFSYYFYYFE